MAHYEPHVYGSRFPYLFHITTIKKNDTVAPHWHEAIEVLALTGGSCSISIDSAQLVARAGDIVVVNSGCVHSIFTDDSCNYFCAIFEEEMWHQLGINIAKTRFLEIFADKQLLDIFKSAGAEQADKSHFYRESMFSFLNLAAVYLCRSKIDKSYSGMSGANFKKIQTVKRAMEYIDTNACKPFSIEQAARDLSFTKYYLCHAFKEITSITIITYLNLRRCDIAEKMIIGSGMQISEVALACGFDNFSYFSRTYKKYKGVSPSKTKSIVV